MVQAYEIHLSDAEDLISLDRNSTGVDKGKGRQQQAFRAEECDRGQRVAQCAEPPHNQCGKSRPKTATCRRTQRSTGRSRSNSAANLSGPFVRQDAKNIEGWSHTTGGALVDSQHNRQSDYRPYDHHNDSATNAESAAHFGEELLATRVGLFGSQALQCYTQLLELGYGETMDLWKLTDTVEACRGDLHSALDRLAAD